MTNLTHTLSEGEHETVVFVSCISKPTDVSPIISSLANTKGGKIIVGVKKSGKIIGINPEEELRQIQEAIEHYCQPKVVFQTKTVHEEMRLLLEINIEPNPTKFVKAKNENDEWQYYIQVKNETILANKIQLNLWKFDAQKIEKPTTLSPNEFACLETIKSSHTPLTISQIYKQIHTPKKDIDTSISLLLHWGMIASEYTEGNFKYHGNNC